MIKVRNVKVLPLYNENFELTRKNRYDLIDMIPGVPIITYEDENNKYVYLEENIDSISKDQIEISKDSYPYATLIGFVSPNSSIYIEDNYITSNVYLVNEKYKDYIFCNYECSIKEIDESNKYQITRINTIEFKKKGIET